MRKKEISLFFKLLYFGGLRYNNQALALTNMGEYYGFSSNLHNGDSSKHTVMTHFITKIMTLLRVKEVLLIRIWDSRSKLVFLFVNNFQALLRRYVTFTWFRNFITRVGRKDGEQQ